MKRLFFFVLLICCFSFVNGQSSQSIGLTTSYFSHNSFTTHFYNIPQLGISSNLFFTDTYGVYMGLAVNRIKFDVDNSPIQLRINNVSYSFHYILKHQQWFAKSGLNATIFNVCTSTYSDNELTQRSFLDSDMMNFAPEIHLGIGRDFDLGKINIRVNGFAQRTFLKGNYFQYGGTVGLFYEFSNKEE